MPELATLDAGRSRAIAAAMVSGNLGDLLAGLDSDSVDVGRLAGRVEVLLWCQAELELELAHWQATDKFADTRGLERFLARVRDSLAAVQDGGRGSEGGAPPWAGLVRTLVDEVTVGGSAEGGPPTP